jgi:flagella basal body P-ring formation protein FlgA
MKALPILLAIFVLIAAFPFGVLAQSVEVRLSPAVITGEESVRLADIARVTYARADEDGEEVLRRLSEIVVHRFSGDEREFRLSYEGIEAIIRAHYKGPLVLVGNGLQITRQQSQIHRRQMTDAIQAYFRKNFPHAVFEVNLHSLPMTKVYPGGNISLEVASHAQGAVSGPFTAELIAACSERELERIPFSGTIRIPGRVLIAARPLERGRTFRSSDARFLEVADIGQEKVVRLEDLAGRRTLEDISEGARLESEQFEKPILVRRGMRVTVVWNREGVHIEAEAIAVDEGREGDVVRLRNSHSGREFSARVGERPGRVYTDG